MEFKPNDLPRWATDAGRTLEPTSGLKDSGYFQGQKPAALHFNWLQNNNYEWINHLKDVPLNTLSSFMLVPCESGSAAFVCEAKEGTGRFVACASVVVASPLINHGYVGETLLTVNSSLTDSGTFTGIASSSSEYVVVGQSAAIRRFTSHGSSSSTSPTAAGGYAGNFLGVRRLGSYFYAFGTLGVVQRSTNGTTWSAAGTVSGTPSIQDICSSGSVYTGCGSGGTLIRSTNGTTWSLISPDASFSGAFYGIDRNDDTVIAVGEGGEIQRSGDGGLTYSQISSTGFTTYRAVKYGNGVWVASGDGVIAASFDDGLTWSQMVGFPSAAFATNCKLDFVKGRFIIPWGSYVLVSGAVV